MKTEQEIDWLTAQIKLSKRHVQQWKILLLAEKQTRRSQKEDHIKERIQLALIDVTARELATIKLITRQVDELTRLTQRLIREQQLMQSRQRLEQTNLDTFIKLQRDALN
jgi:hypothetical protein